MKRSDFRFFHRLRVRWAEVDAQKIVFNGHYLMYFDTAISDYWRALGLPYPDALEGFGGDLYVKKASVEYHASARYDDVLDVRIRTMRVGTTSFLIASEFRRFAAAPLLVSAETVYVSIDPKAGTKKAVTQAQRSALEAGAPGIVVDHAGALR